VGVAGRSVVRREGTTCKPAADPADLLRDPEAISLASAAWKSQRERTFVCASREDGKSNEEHAKMAKTQASGTGFRGKHAREHSVRKGVQKKVSLVGVQSAQATPVGKDATKCAAAVAGWSTSSIEGCTVADMQERMAALLPCTHGPRHFASHKVSNAYAAGGRPQDAVWKGLGAFDVRVTGPDRRCRISTHCYTGDDDWVSYNLKDELQSVGTNKYVSGLVESAQGKTERKRRNT
jgi:hypothetical protein